MKKMLLLLVCLTTFAWLHADEVTFDFSKAGYSNTQKITKIKVTLASVICPVPLLVPLTCLNP